MSQPRRSRNTEKPAPVRVTARDLRAPVRLDRFLRDQFPDAGRRALQSLISGGRVSINGRQVRLSSWEVRNGDRVEMATAPRAKPRPFERFDDGWIVADDGEIIALNKPAGLLSEPARAPGAVSLVRLAREHFGPVTLFHRLDRDTSGIILLTRSGPDNRSNRYLANAFRQRDIAKLYVAVVAAPNQLQPEGVISALIDHNPARRDKMAVVERGGKPAVTHYQVLAETEEVQWLLLRPQTGRTHQLRVHLAHLGAPILGDRLYGVRDKSVKRLMLHAWRIGLPEADGFETRNFEAPLPPDLLSPPDGWPAELGAMGGDS